MRTDITNRSFKDYPTEAQCAEIRNTLEHATKTPVIVCMQHDIDVVAFEKRDADIPMAFATTENCKEVTAEDGRELFVCDIEELQKIAEGAEKTGYSLCCTLRPENKKQLSETLGKEEGEPFLV